MSKFNIVETRIDGLIVIEPTVLGDERGFFMETYAERDFRAMGIDAHFVQDNHSLSNRGVLRGMHFQRRHAQGKLIRVVSGLVLDVVVDMRPESPTFGRWESVLISARDKRMLYVPPRFAHGFLTLEDGTEFLYKCTDYYDPQSDSGVMWNDPELGIDWQLERFGLTAADLNISKKDTLHPQFSQLDRYAIWE